MSHLPNADNRLLHNDLEDVLFIFVVLFNITQQAPDTDACIIIGQRLYLCLREVGDLHFKRSFVICQFRWRWPVTWPAAPYQRCVNQKSPQGTFLNRLSHPSVDEVQDNVRVWDLVFARHAILGGNR